MSVAFEGNPGLAAFGRDFLQIGHNFSDDCLTLNLWTKPQTGEKHKAVLVFFYGGGKIKQDSGLRDGRIADRGSRILAGCHEQQAIRWSTPS